MIKIIERIVRNRSKRKEGAEIDCIVLHATGKGTILGAIDWFNRPESLASAHYIIDRDGTIYRCVPDDEKAWHAGDSAFQGVHDVNQFSIGIELHSISGEYPTEQIKALVELTTDLIRRFPAIRMDRIVSHADVATPKGRKADPMGFPWAGYRAQVRWRLTELGL